MFAIKSHRVLLTVLACSLSVSSVFAEEGKDKQPSKAKKWSANLSLGLNTSEGNTNIGRANVGFLVKHGVKKPGSLQHTLLGAYDYGDRGFARGSNRIETKNDKELSYKFDYNLSNHRSLVAYVGYEDNIQAKLESQKMVGVGYEFTDLGSKRHNFSAGLGLGYLSVDYTDGTPGFSGEALRASAGYRGKITQRFSVSTGLVVLAAEERTMIRSVSKLDYALSDRSSLVLKYKSTQYDSIPTTALDKKDNTTNLNVVFRF